MSSLPDELEVPVGHGPSFWRHLVASHLCGTAALLILNVTFKGAPKPSVTKINILVQHFKQIIN